MSTLTNPSEIARETLRQLAGRRMPPTPDNFRTLYHEIAGTNENETGFPETHLRALAAGLPKTSPDQLRLVRDLENAIKLANWDNYRTRLTEFINAHAETQKLAWGDLIDDLMRQWEIKHLGITSAKKRDSLEHVLKSAGSNPDTLFKRLQNLVRSWSQGQTAEMAFDGEVPPMEEGAEPSPEAGATAKPATAVPSGGTSVAGNDILPELRELFAYTLETAVATQLVDAPQLAGDARILANDIRKASNSTQLQEFLERLKRFAFKLELLAEDNAELRKSLLNLLRLLVDNMSELVMDDRWLQGQVDIVRDVIQKPLSQRAVDDAEQRLKEVLFKQSQLKQSLQEAKEALKTMLSGFVDHLANFADVTSDYHDVIEQCAVKISAANDITELENVIAEVMRETRNMQLSAQRSRDDLRTTQQSVTEKEARIRELEMELEKTSELVRYDQLTGALNRRGLEEMFEREMARSTRHETHFCVALLDLDNFKKLNDTMGHDAGDEALIHLTTVCRDALRPQDTLARFGGEEFIILLPETNLDDAVTALTRLQRELTKRYFLHKNERTLITFSAGVTEVRPDDNQATVTKRADEAMYKAKKSGKNRVETG